MPQAAPSISSSSHQTWRPTKIMNMRDLSRDDDFLSHLLVEKLGTGAVPLVVHKMDASRLIPKADPHALLQIVRRLVVTKGAAQTAIRDAVDELLTLPAVRYYIRNYDQKQINAFATHASRYFELYLPSSSIEIAHTSRYSHKTGKSELCILATRPLAPTTVITELKGSMADLTEEEDAELKRIDGACIDGVQIRRDFSVIHSKQLKKNHLFLGPARFVNHDCDHNVELFREGRYITFRVRRPIAVGEEVTAHYGDGYFGVLNRHCLCETCEKLGRGGYALNVSDDEASDSGLGSPTRMPAEENDPESDDSESEEETAVNVNERSTRRGVYAVVKEKTKEKGKGKLIELEAEVEPDNASDLTSLPPSRASVAKAGPSKGSGLMTPDPEPGSLQEWLRGVDSPSVPSTPGKSTTRAQASMASTPTSFKSVIATRGQKARGDADTEHGSPAPSVVSVRGRRGRGRGGRRARGGRAESVRQLVTPPLTAESTSASASASIRSSSRIRTRSGDLAGGSSRLTTPAKESQVETGSTVSARAKGKQRAVHEPEASESEPESSEPEPEPEKETRTLRPRAALMGHGAGLEQSASARNSEAPRDVDGKLLPTCVTCRNVLPVIHVEGKPIWGLSLGRTGKRGRPRKHVNVECPRCMRHFEIYNLKWPERLPGDGSASYLPTPREMRNSTPATTSALSHMHGKLDLAKNGYAIPKRPYKRRREVDDATSGPAKKPKTAETGTGRPRGRPPKNRVGMSNKAKEMLGVHVGKVAAKATVVDSPIDTGRRSGRARVPSLKLRESVPPKEQVPSHSRARSSVSRPPESHSTTTTLSSSLTGSDRDTSVSLEVPKTPVKEKGEGVQEQESPKLLTPKSLAVAAQPRESNGRFGKKLQTNGRYMRKGSGLGGAGRRSRVQRAFKRDRLKARELQQKGSNQENQAEGDSLGHAGPSHPEGEPAESRKRSVEEPEDDGLDLPAKKMRTGGDRDTDDESEDEEDPDEAEEDSDDEPHFFRPALYSARGNNLLRAPNPLTYARRKWNSANPFEYSSGASRASTSASRQSSTDDDTDLPLTPEDVQDPPVVDVDALTEHLERGEDEGDDTVTFVPLPRPAVSASAFVGKLTLKPSPVNLARRVWAPPPAKQPRADNVSERLSHAPEDDSALELQYPYDDGLEYYDDEDRYSSSYESSDEEGDMAEKAECLRDLASSPKGSAESDLLDQADTLLDLAKSPKQSIGVRSPSLQSVDSDSERSVEKLVRGSPSAPSDPSDTSRPVSSHCAVEAQDVDKSPGMAWKRTVLLPTNIPYLKDRSLSFSANLHSSPVKFTPAGWETASESDS